MFDWLTGLPPVDLMVRFWRVYAAVNAAHILGLALLVGAIVPLDLRLLGVLRSPPLAGLAPFLVRVAAVGAGIAITTGLLLFGVRPGEYLANPAFLVKLGALAIGLANVAVVHRLPQWRRASRGEAAPAPVVRLTAGVSMLSWLVALVAGRFIGFL